jgi:DNA sulfur modification protein DndC
MVVQINLDFQDLLKSALHDLETMYLDQTDIRDWAIAWSGGKDSTCVMGMVVKMLESLPSEKRTRIIHAVMSDTVIENPNLELYMHDQVDKLSKYIEDKKLPMTVSLVQREPEQSYFYLILGRGYFLPQNNGAGRWCTDRLKLQPQNRKLKEINPSYILIGARLSESEKRKQSIEKWTGKNDLSYKIGDHANLVNSKTFMPIIDFTIEDVWRYLSVERLPWSSTHAVRTLYKEATGECGFTNPRETEKMAAKAEACGARFGCWVCPVILNDRSTEQMAETHEWMKPLTEWRTLQMQVFGDYIPPRPEGQKRKERSEILSQWREINQQIKLVTKSGHKRNGNRMVDRTGNIRDDQGTITVEAREFLYEELLKTEKEVNKLRQEKGLKTLTLISNEEKKMIQKQWEFDRNKHPWLVTNVNGYGIDRLKELLAKASSIK